MTNDTPETDALFFPNGRDHSGMVVHDPMTLVTNFERLERQRDAAKVVDGAAIDALNEILKEREADLAAMTKERDALMSMSMRERTQP